MLGMKTPPVSKMFAFLKPFKFYYNTSPIERAGVVFSQAIKNELNI